ncbi:TIGR02300 family protein [Methylobacterium mesophilicum SR1.6/6]|uniref:TIGR02300 family protein n=1 Tax=Methylobacterium mesophilicum SR1.6/6 TaxID=908290 RepID=A0A6B9FB86_9HYPH|nr:TIGR02300 family protein [Methylobacterium mesophilicum]QGY00931.1 TIGR02300 family protein [Methylobacterium mesophilicum SR1.6/6]
MARPELGLKRQCMSCGAKFYDLARDPAVCPKCGVVYQAAATSRVSAPALSRAPNNDDEDETDEKGPEMVSLDEVEAAEDEADPTPEDDTAEDGDTADDDTFLEEEDSGDDDVSDLIDGDIENDEES